MTNLNAVTAVPEKLNGEADRKWFAGLAMQAMIAKQGIPESLVMREEIALWAHRMAEAMVRTSDRLHATEMH